MSNIAALNQRYGIPGQVGFTVGPDGLVMAELANRHGTATVSLQGGQLLSWAPHGSRPVIWLSPAAVLAPGKAIRGGVPVCWPWFGPHPTQPGWPAHGIARTSPWEVIATRVTESGDTHLVLRLMWSDASRALWPYPCQLEIGIGLGAALAIELVTRNTGNEPVTVGEALHTYFEVGDIRRIAVQGLDACHYIDKVDGGRRKRQDGSVSFSAETDRVYLDTEADCWIDDPDLQRRIRISKRGSRSTVVWNPWREKAAGMGDLGEEAYRNMVCVESANAADNLVTIAAGTEHRLAAVYGIEALPGVKP